MTTNFATVLAWTALPVIDTSVGGIVPVVRTAGPTVRSGLQHFAGFLLTDLIA